MTINLKLQFPVFLLVIIINLSIVSPNSFSFDNAKIFFAGHSAATYCYESLGGTDLYSDSLFNRLKATPPPGFTIEPLQDIVAQEPCSTSHPEVNGYGGLKILDWNTECLDSSGAGVCSWSCNDCPNPECEIHQSTKALGGETDWCCCASRRTCIDQSDAQYVMLNLGGNDLLHLFKFYGGDVDQVVEEAKSLTTYITAQGRTVIWLTAYPGGYGSLGNGESPCSDILSCLLATNSNAEYFLEQFIPWIDSQSDVYLIDFFGHIKETYAPNPISFIDTYGYDGVHLKPSGHQIFYDYLYPRLTALLTEINDQDGDGILNDSDNCPATPNGTTLGTCVPNTIGETCTSNEGCGNDGICSMNQEDTHPPGGNNCGDACECEGNFDGDDDQDGSDAFIFKEDFGRNNYQRPCGNEDSCHGDFDCDVDVDGTDAFIFKEDFGRSQYENPCPLCVTEPWCCYEEITVSGGITCDAYTLGPIYGGLKEAGTNIDLCEFTLESIDNYECSIPPENLHKEVYVFAQWEHDNYSIPDCYASTGDYWGKYGELDETFHLQCTNRDYDMDLNNKITKLLEGEVACDEFDGSGALCTYVWDCPYDPNDFCLVGPSGCYPLLTPGPFNTFVSNIDPNDPDPEKRKVWLIGHWSKDGNCGPPQADDYIGVFPEPIDIGDPPSELILDACQIQVQ